MARFQCPVFENEHPLGDAPPLAVPTLNIQLRCGRKRGRIGLCVGMIIWRNQLNRLAEACVHRAAADGAVVEEAPSARRKSHHAPVGTTISVWVPSNLIALDDIRCFAFVRCGVQWGKLMMPGSS